MTSKRATQNAPAYPPPIQRGRRARNFTCLWLVFTVLVGFITFGLAFVALGRLGSAGEGLAIIATTPSTPTITPPAVETASPTPQAPAAPPPTNTPSATPTPVPTINAPEIQGFLPDDFEIGAHITGEIVGELAQRNWNWMRVGGLTWVKIQLRFTRGMNPEDYGWKIQELNSQGFNVLWGVVAEKEEVLTDGFFQEYATFVAGLAQRGSGAIEVLNEVNLDREWPNGRIDPAKYTELLRLSYQAIKAANPQTLVISAGLAPTGAEGAFGLNAVWNDDRYYRGLAAAGAADYMDCVGAHYNEGIVSPTRTDGDPRDPYPTRYLRPNTARAYDPFGGKVPVCYTELGYLTPQGDRPLPPGFEWASNVTLAQQASWLATAALINAQDGKVRLMIIWNLDKVSSETDPMGGFAIIRPDGACPACDSLGAIRQPSFWASRP